MKLIIQIPCYNEEKTLPQTVNDIRNVDFAKELPNVKVELLIIDDGSNDSTYDVAKNLGVNHIVRHNGNRGLAAAFKTGLDFALKNGADILVNTDADNQYCAADIPKLVQPILEKQADLVVGCRPILQHKEFSPLKKMLQLLGSWVLRKISKTTVRDAASGFRAFSRDTCMRLFIHSKFSYCMETLIQAGNSDLRVVSTEIRVNPTTRPSRLFNGIFQYIRKSGGTMLAMFALYRPGRFFLITSIPCWFIAFLIGLRAIYHFVFNGKRFGTFIPSYFMLLFFATLGIVLCLSAILGELLRAQRKITEQVLYLQRKESLKSESGNDEQ